MGGIVSRSCVVSRYGDSVMDNDRRRRVFLDEKQLSLQPKAKRSVVKNVASWQQANNPMQMGNLR